jgi:hypothetical protein
MLESPVPSIDIAAMSESLRQLDVAVSSRGTQVAAVDWAKVRSELIELRPLLDQLLTRSEQKEVAPPLAMAGAVAGIIQGAVTALAPIANATGRIIEVKMSGEAAAVAPPADLDEAVRELLSSALASGTGPIVVQASTGHDGKREVLAIEVRSNGLDVADRARRRLTKAVGVHRGQTSFVSGQTESSARITIPVMLPAPRRADLVA